MSAQGEIGPEGRVMVRYCGTEPLVRILVEGPALSTVQKVAKELVDYFESAFS